MSEPGLREHPAKDVALIVGGGPGISASCARMFAKSGMRVGIAARSPDKPVLQNLETEHGVRRYACDAADPAAVEGLFQSVVRDLGTPTLVVHNIDGRVPGIFKKSISEADPGMALETLRNAAFSAFLVGQQAARLMRENTAAANGAKGTIIFTNASAALKGFPASGAFAMACHAKSGLAQSMARELMPQGIHVANVPIDAAIGFTQGDGTRAHRRAGTTVDDNMADPDHIAETYLQLHRQYRWMITWSACFQGLDVGKAELAEIEPIDKDINSSDRVVLTDVVIELRGEQAGLPAIKTLHEPRHRPLRRITRKS